MHNVIEIIILFVFFFYHNLKYIYHLSEKALFLSVFDFLGFRDPRFQGIRYFLCLLELWGFLFIKLGKSYNKCELYIIRYLFLKYRLIFL